MGDVVDVLLLVLPALPLPELVDLSPLDRTAALPFGAGELLHDKALDLVKG